MYRDTQYLFEQEISRIERTTEEHRSRLEEIQGGINEEIYRELESRREPFEQATEKFQEYSSGMGKRYIRKISELREQQKDIDREIELRFKVGRSEEDIRRQYSYQEK